MSQLPAHGGVGKRVLDELYVHLDWVGGVQFEGLAARIQQALQTLRADTAMRPNVAKVGLRSDRLSLLAYPRFEEDAFPALAASWTFSHGSGRPPTYREYVESTNPPILHRKELLVGEEHPDRRKWVAVTASAEELGLFDDTTTIGFQDNWRRALAARGLELVDNAILPLGNDRGTDESVAAPQSTGVMRHLTALGRTALSTPVQLLLRHGLLAETDTFFDYGCGKGDDLAALSEACFDASGWDPYFRPDAPLRTSDAVNLGFVLNVIEDAAERVDALHRAFALARKVMSVAVMLQSTHATGVPFRDGLLTSRGTFQKYFSQEELRDFVESVLHRPTFTVGPGVVFVFADIEAEQRFAAARHRTHGLAARLIALRPPSERKPLVTRIRVRPPARPSRIDELYAQHEGVLTRMWTQALELGRWPEREELPDELQPHQSGLTYARSQRLLASRHDLQLLARAAQVRRDDILVFLATQQFSKRPLYRKLEERLQRDIRAFFGDYGKANREALAAIVLCADSAEVLAQCKAAASRGFGWLQDEHSLQLHMDLVPSLPALLRVYVACGRVLWDPGEKAQLVKIHTQSGKVSFLEFDDFDSDPAPSLRRRIKIDLRKLRCQVFEYGSPQYPKPVLLYKSRYLHEDMPSYATQEFIDQRLQAALPAASEVLSITRAQLDEILGRQRLQLRGDGLARCSSVPDLDQLCGANFSFRDFIECGETFRRLRISNVPRNPESYNALHDLAVKVLDPVIEYFGGIRLTYGFSSEALSKKISGRIAPKLDQHAACETDAKGRAICKRLGAACDFIVDDEDMFEVARWIMHNLEFDRLYVYGKDRPIHVSFGPEMSRASYLMRPTKTGAAVPHVFW